MKIQLKLQEFLVEIDNSGKRHRIVDLKNSKNTPYAKIIFKYDDGGFIFFIYTFKII